MSPAFYITSILNVELMFRTLRNPASRAVPKCICACINKNSANEFDVDWNYFAALKKLVFNFINDQLLWLRNG